MVRYICEHDDKFTHTAKRITQLGTDTFEIPICPICHTNVYDEYVLDQKKITSVVSVDLADVDEKLKEGYEVESLYAKTATLVRRD